jgi:hypothetical protein
VPDGVPVHATATSIVATHGAPGAQTGWAGAVAVQGDDAPRSKLVTEGASGPAFPDPDDPGDEGEPGCPCGDRLEAEPPQAAADRTRNDERNEAKRSASIPRT